MAKMTDLILNTTTTPAKTTTTITATTQNTPTRSEKRKKKIKYRDKMKFLNALLIGLIVVVINKLEMASKTGRDARSGGVLAQTRDPRFYSRVGVNDFKWPNPGDPDYR